MMSNKPYLILVVLVLLLCQVGSSTIAVQAQPDQRNGVSFVNRLAGQPVDQISRSIADPENTDFFIFLPVVLQNYCADFFDNFSNSASGWDVMDDEYMRAEYLIGEYRILSKKEGYVYWSPAPTCKRETYVVEVDARWASTPGGSYGIIFGILPDYSQYYLFEVDSDNQAFSVWQRVPGDWYLILPWSLSYAIGSGPLHNNHLKVTREGIQIILEVNGVVLSTFSDPSLTGPTYAGVMTDIYNDHPPYDARFDNFSVKSLPGSGLPVQSSQEAFDFTSGADSSIGKDLVVPAPTVR